MGRTATWDIYCHAFMMGAIYYLYLALRQNPCKWTYFIGAGIFMGLSFLGKVPYLSTPCFSRSYVPTSYITAKRLK